MKLKKVKPVSAGRRFQTYSTFEEITETLPEKKLLCKIRSKSGRNCKGRITARHRGGQHKRRYRIIDFRRNKIGIPAKVLSIQYDPNRSARIALLSYNDGEKSYILAPLDVQVGDIVISGAEADIKAGNTLPVSNIPLGTYLHNIELRPGKGGQLVRSAGVFAQLMAKDEKYAMIKLPSGEVRMFLAKCKATVGQLGNLINENISFGKAGRNRWLGNRPKVRGVAMNPVDHPMGGGEGRSSGGRHPCSPWGLPSKGYKTRRKGANNRFIVKKRS